MHSDHMRSSRSRWITRTLVGSAVVALLVTPGITGTRRSAAEDMNLQRTWVELFNARKFDELANIYEEDAVALPPNHEPVRGRAAIKEYFVGIRDSVGEVKCAEPSRLTYSGDLVAIVAGECSAHGGVLRFNAHELYARQADGSLRYRFDMFGMR